MDKGKSIQGESIEKPKGLEIKKLDAPNFRQYERQIMGLEVNALDRGEDRGFTAREKHVKDLYDQYLESGKRGELFVAIKSERVIGFVALKKEPGEHKKAHIEQFRLESEVGQESLVEKMLQGVRHSLEHEGYHRASIAHLESPHEAIETFKHVDWFEKFYTIEKKGDESGDTHLEKAA